MQGLIRLPSFKFHFAIDPVSIVGDKAGIGTTICEGYVEKDFLKFDKIEIDPNLLFLDCEITDGNALV